MELWIARDMDGGLWCYDARPILNSTKEYFTSIDEDFEILSCIELPEDWMPEVTFENSPKKVELKLVEE